MQEIRHADGIETRNLKADRIEYIRPIDLRLVPGRSICSGIKAIGIQIHQA
jgi:hypothetical protein